MIAEQRTRSSEEGPTEGYYIVTAADTSETLYGPLVVDHKVKEMTDVVTPGYKKLVNRGVIINNPCNYVVTDKTHTGSTSGGVGTNTMSGFLTRHVLQTTDLDIVFPEVAWPELAVSVTDAKLQALARIDPTPYAFGEDTYELGETLRFLKDPLGSLRNLSDAWWRRQTSLHRKYRKGDAVKGLKDLSSALADNWASYSFAAAPLTRSCMDAIEAWHTLPSKVNVKGTKSRNGLVLLRLASRGKSDDEWIGDWTLKQYPGAGTSRTWIIHREKSNEVRAHVLYNVSNPCTDMRVQLGLGSKAFPVTMWQIVPLSFLVDRFYDISSFLKASINLGDPKVKILAGSVTKRYRQFETAQYASYYHPTLTSTLSGETAVDEYFSYDRQVWYPSFTDAVPKVKPLGLVENASKLADLTSIMIKRLL